MLLSQILFLSSTHMHKKETESEIKTSYFKGVPGCHSEILDWASRESDPKIKQDQREKEGQCLFTFLGHCPLTGPMPEMTLAFCTGDAAHQASIGDSRGKLCTDWFLETLGI